MSVEPIRPQVPAIRTGGQVAAIIPQSIEEVFRVAKGVVQSGLAPDALVKGKDVDSAAMAVAVAIMSGAELGLKPMVSLRSFTVINNKPALYGDGLINVVRQSGKVTRLATGCDTREGKLVGWCEAKRNDTDEEKRVEFSQDDAVRAGLWATSGSTPWAKYPQRMLAWRAAGWCLRELFGDVLGGIRDEFEAQDSPEIEQQVIAPPPPPPAEDVVDIEPFDLEAWFTDFETQLAAADSAKTVAEVMESTGADTLADPKAKMRASVLIEARLKALTDARPYVEPTFDEPKE
jgi:hypothetical protein